MPEKWPDKRKYKWTSHVVLTKPEGEVMQSILDKHECQNASQFCKKLVRGELIVKEGNVKADE